jgi:16S rRNA (uracil1498-N3)-methyltransferase
MGRSEVSVQVGAHAAIEREAPHPIQLAVGMPANERMDWLVEKATELGVAGIVPLLTERSEVRLDAERAAKRLAHWQSVAISACEQSGRARVPRIAPIQPLAAWLGGLADDGALRLALLPSAEKTIGALRFSATGGVLVIGPEGGLGEADTRALAQHGFHGLRLGPRILRTETAGLAALSALQACHGDLATAGV